MPPAELLLDTHTSRPCFCLRMCGSTARLTRCVPSTLTSYCWANCSGVNDFGRAEHHVPGIVDDHVDAAALGDDLLDRGVGRWLRLHVELDGAQIDAVACRGRGHLGGIRRVAAGDVAHRGVDGVAGLGERFGGQAAEAAGSAGDEDDLLGATVLESFALDMAQFLSVASALRADAALRQGLKRVLRVVIR